MAEPSTGRLLEHSLVTGIVAGTALGACFMLGLAGLEILSANASDLELVPIAVAAARAIIGSVAAIGAGATVYLVYGPLGSGEDGARLGLAVATVMLGAAVAGWFLTLMLLRLQG